MIAEIAQDLVDKLKTNAEFGDRVSLILGGQKFDPTNRQLAMPSAWVLFDNIVATQKTNSSCLQPVTLQFVTKILLPYGDVDLTGPAHLPFLEAVIKSVRGTQAILGANNWRFEQLVWDEISDRMVFEATFSIEATL